MPLRHQQHWHSQRPTASSRRCLTRQPVLRALLASRLPAHDDARPLEQSLQRQLRRRQWQCHAIPQQHEQQYIAEPEQSLIDAAASNLRAPALDRRALLCGGAIASAASWLAQPQLALAAEAAAAPATQQPRSKVCLMPAQPKVKLPVPSAVVQPGFKISRVIKGCWPGPTGDAALPAAEMDKTMASGVTTFDTGDVDDGRAELAMGRWLATRAPEDRAKVQVLTRLSFTDIFDMATVSKGVIAQELAFKVRDLGSPPDMVQLHWGTWKQPKWLDTVQWLADEQAAGRFKHLGLVNFDAEQLAAVLGKGVKVASVQVPYSLVDRRAEGALLPFCREKGVPVIAALPLAGGLISGGYLGVAAEQAPNNFTSLRGKYGRLLISAGEWAWFQELLAALATIGSKHGVPASAVAARWVLDQPGVAAAVRPARNPSSQVLGQPFSFRPDMEDRKLMNEVLEQSVRAAGSVYAYERGLGPFW